MASPLYLEPRRSGSPVISLTNVLLPLTGVTPDGRWYRVVYQDQVLWIERSGFNQIQGDINAVPVVEPPTAVPTETPLPTVTPTFTLTPIPPTVAPTEISAPTATPTAAPNPAVKLHVGEQGAQVYTEASHFSPVFASALNVDLQITGITSDGKWFQVLFEGQLGWIEKSIFVRLDGDVNSIPVIDPASLPTAAPADTSPPAASPTVPATSASLRIGGLASPAYLEPRRSSEKYISLFNVLLPLTGITADSKWYRVDYQGQQIWIEKSTFNQVEGDLSTVPVITESASNTVAEASPTAAPAVTTDSSVLLVIGGIGADIHTEPSRSSPVAASVESVDLPLTGITADGKWYRVVAEGQEGWVEKSLFNRVEGDIATVPVIETAS